MDRDQQARSQTSRPDPGDDIWTWVREVDVDNTTWLTQIIDRHGWPRRNDVGKDVATAAWLLAQHADHDPDFQRHCLGLLEQAVADGVVASRAPAIACCTCANPELTVRRRPRGGVLRHPQTRTRRRPSTLEQRGRRPTRHLPLIAFDNRRRRHSALGYRSPAEYERTLEPTTLHRLRHNPVSRPPGEAQFCHPHSVNVDTPPGRHADMPNSVSTNTVNGGGQGTRGYGAVPAIPPHRSGPPRRRRTGPPR
ncbi:hypothetical protein SAMN05443287_12315 [Micromonospora phaseoli]|uniref:Uncharacterized protein n=1 Tax=Micromonospora phaseoli TaxID=1144548 RepID=A0A1H7DZ22_9ACTN|nr:hypothetical protein CLV64_12012 [Micromonospora phaseoli]SEK06993.1 hypothetical protein SAMN05443287_12315 [Micromonospora phaseoli]